jgi:hypothetical protein
MYAEVREAILSDEAGFNAAHQAFAAILAQTPGLRSTIRLDAGERRQVLIAVWESAAAAQAAAPRLGAAATRLLDPHTTHPGKQVYAGPVLADTPTTP